MVRSVPVMGATMYRPLGTRLKESFEMTRAGRMPPCSRPTRGSKSTSQTSPSLGARVLGTNLLLFRRRVVRRLVLEAIHGAARKESDLVLVVCPGRMIRPQPGEVLADTLPELRFLVL